MPVTPTITIVPRTRASSPANSTGPLLFVEAVMITASAPIPPEASSVDVRTASGSAAAASAPETLGQRHPIGRRIVRHDPAAGAPEQLHGQLPDESQSEHDADVAEAHPRAAHPMQRDRAEHPERTRLHRHPRTAGRRRAGAAPRRSRRGSPIPRRRTRRGRRAGTLRRPRRRRATVPALL